MNYHLCDTCNLDGNYYPKLNDESNRDSFIQCYDKNVEQIGYYVDNDNKIFKPCYNKCKRCERAGDDTNNYCLECNDEDKIADANGNCKCKNYYIVIIIEKSIKKRSFFIFLFLNILL